MKFGRWLPWIYALPMIVFVVGIFAYPIATLFLYSVQNVGTVGLRQLEFRGAQTISATSSAMRCSPRRSSTT